MKEDNWKKQMNGVMKCRKGFDSQKEYLCQAYVRQLHQILKSSLY